MGMKKFVFFSDNCCGQNKNKNYLAMLWYCLKKFKLTAIEHKYLEKGHTQNENDSVPLSLLQKMSAYTLPLSGQLLSGLQVIKILTR